MSRGIAIGEAEARNRTLLWFFAFNLPQLFIFTLPFSFFTWFFLFSTFPSLTFMSFYHPASLPFSLSLHLSLPLSISILPQKQAPPTSYAAIIRAKSNFTLPSIYVYQYIKRWWLTTNLKKSNEMSRRILVNIQ